jgi:hypothetical protein
MDMIPVEFGDHRTFLSWSSIEMHPVDLVKAENHDMLISTNFSNFITNKYFLMRIFPFKQ